MALDLILRVGFRSDGRGDLWATAAVERAGTLCSAAAHDGGRRSLPNLALRGSIRLAPGLGVNYTPCVIDLGY